MAEVITTLIFCPVSLDTSYTLTVTDDSGAGRSVTINPSGTNYYLAFVKPSGGTGASEQLPLSLSTHLSSRLNNGTGHSYWSESPTAAGLVRLAYSGPTTGQITSWGSGNVIRTLLGFDTTVSIASGGTQTAAYIPPYTLAAIGRARSTGWDRRKPRAAYATTDDGRSYGWSDSVRQMCQTFDLIGHASTRTVRSSLGAAGTPLYPDTASRYTTPPSTAVTSSNVPALPWSVLDFVDSAIGHDLYAFLGTYQTALTGGTTTMDRVQLDPDFYLGDSMFSPTQQNWSARVDVKRVALCLVTKDVSM